MRPRPSLEVHFSDARRIRDAVIFENFSKTRLQFVDSVTQVLSWKASFLKAAVRLRDLHKPQYEASMMRTFNVKDSEAHLREAQEVIEEVHSAVSSAIRFATQSPPTLQDALHCPKQSWPFAQRIMRELKLLDASVGLMDAMWEAGYKVIEATASTNVKIEGLDQKQASRVAHGPVLTTMEDRSLKLIVEFWRASFQSDRDSENYFFRNKWLDKINNLNGLGLGAGQCLAALVSNNKRLLQGVSTETLQVFIDYIGQLGPDDTWLHFMAAVCSCEGQAIANKQQQVLQMMYYPGNNCSPEDLKKWGNNRYELFLGCTLSKQAKTLFPENAAKATRGCGDIPGRDLVMNGIRDIWVSWRTNMEPWGLNKDWLFYHPQHLGLTTLARTRITPKLGNGPIDQNWVSLAEVCWVLDPEMTYAYVHPQQPRDTWAKESKHIVKTGRFKARMLLAKYMVCQIDLMREMCLDFQVNAMKALQAEYNFDLICCAIWDYTLPPMVRKSFCSYLSSLWLHRYPHLELQLVPICHVWDALQQATVGEIMLPSFKLFDRSLERDPESTAFDRFSQPSKFNVLISYVKHHFLCMQGRMVHSWDNAAAYTAEVVLLFQRLLHFGFVNEAHLVETMRPIIACLDGRTDWLDCPIINVEAPGGSACSPEDTLGQTSRATEDGSDPTSPLLCSPGSRNSRSASKVAGGGSSHTNGKDSTPLYFKIDNPADGPRRYPVDKKREAILHAKVLMCGVCTTILDMAAGNGITQLARLFAQWSSQSQGGIKAVDLSAKDVSRLVSAIRPPQMNFDALADCNFNAILIDLMMYEHPKLFTASMKVMWTWNHQLDAVLTKAAELIIIAEKQEADAFEQLKCDVARLSNMICTIEDWAISHAPAASDRSNPLSGINRAKFEEARRLLEKTRFVCSVGNIDSEVPNNRMQAILASLRLGEEIMRAYDTPFEDFMEKSDGCLHEFMLSVSMLLHQFVLGMPKNQRFFYQRLEKLSEWHGKDVGIAQAIGGIFRGNRPLCENVSEDLVYDVGRKLVQARRAGSKFMPQHLDFLQSLIVTGQRPIIRNKELILSMLKNPYYAEVLHIMETPPMMKRRQELLTRFKSFQELEKPAILRKWAGEDGEVQYHIRCLTMLAKLCIGRDESGGSAFVQAKFPPKQLVMSYMSINEAQKPGCSQQCLYICLLLKSTILDLVNSAYYDTDLKDDIFYNSSRHVELLAEVYSELAKLQEEMTRRSLAKVEEDFLCQILKLFNSLVEHTTADRWHLDIEPMLRDRVHPLAMELNLPHYTVPNHNHFFKTAVSRLLGWLQNDDDLKQQRLIEMAPEEAPGDRSRQFTLEVQEFVKQLRQNEHMKKVLEQEKAAMVDDVCGIYVLSNVGDEAYQREKERAQAEGRPIKGGFRRNPISTTAIMSRFISHCLEGENLKDWTTTYYVIEILCKVLESLQGPKQELALKEMQLTCARGGAERLVIDALCSRPEARVIQSSLRLAQLLLRPNNKDVQEVFVTYFYSVDDYQLWYLFKEMVEMVQTNLKHVRNLKRIARSSGKDLHQALTSEEVDNLSSFSENVQSLKEALCFLQLLCEGHNKPVQRYVFQQIDNSFSVNILEKLKELVLKICKNDVAADVCDQEDMDVMTTCFEVLVETTTRPDPRNQLFLSTSGIVEGVMKMMQSRFVLLRLQGDEDGEPLDCFPSLVRRLKGQVTLLLLTLLELRQDLEVHRTIVIRTDPNLLRHRLIFTHRWFLAAHHHVGPRPHICSEEGDSLLDDPKSDDGVVVSPKPPVELLEGYKEEDLLDLFEESFNIMLLIHGLNPIDNKFRESLDYRIKPFDESLQLRISPEAFEEEKISHLIRSKYNRAYLFFDEWIKMVEVLADGKVHDVFFRMPVLCHYVLGSEKDDILTLVNIESPEAKVKDFVNRCKDLYDMTLHTRNLSQWTPKALGWLKLIFKGYTFRPLLFFLKQDSKNLVMSTYVNLALALIINILLFLGLKVEDPSNIHSIPVIISPTLSLATWSVGLLYFIIAAIQFVVVCLTYTPMDHDRTYLDSQTQNLRLLETLAVMSIFPLVFVLRFFHLLHMSGVIFLPIVVLYTAGIMWTPETTHCPRNIIARSVATAYVSIKRQAIFRRFFFVTMAICAILREEYYYTFLLLDIMFIFDKLKNIIKAVTTPIESLALTMMVGIILMYEYAVIAFFYYRQDYSGGSCNTMGDCTLMTIYLGMREDIGQSIAEVSPPDPGKHMSKLQLEQHNEHFYGRIAFDLSFFVLITTIGMNILFGIIVDTFGALRDAVQERETYRKRTTFIGSLDRSDIDKAARTEGILSGFDYMENDRQDKWNYMYFVFYLRRKDPINYSGPETRINKLIHDEDISWLPIYTCTLLQQQREKAAAEAANAAAKAAAAGGANT